MTQTNPVLVEVWRGDQIESQHRGIVCVTDTKGDVVFSCGDIDQAVYPRSSLKPIQALSLIESGAARALGLSARQISLGCASHNGESMHTALVSDWLNDLGFSESTLCCGVQNPGHEPTYTEMIRVGMTPTQIHNNCSGKHSGFLSIVKHLGMDHAGYVDVTHPVQRLVTQTIEEECEIALNPECAALDGCNIPLFAIPVKNVARAFARFSRTFRDARQTSRQQLVAAILQEPLMIAGNDRFCSRVIKQSAGTAIMKTGAEGYFTGCLLDQGLGIAIKIDDGSTRASEVAMASVLRRFSGDRTFRETLDIECNVTLTNRKHQRVGFIKAATAINS